MNARKKSQMKKKESPSVLLKKKGERRRLVYRQASASEANAIEQAIDRLLAELVRRERAGERTSS
jgi:hypothetical protein